MLMKALITRLNGGTDTFSKTAPSSHRRSTKLVYQKVPSLPTLLLRLLGSQNQVSHSHDSLHTPKVQAVFPALEIVERFGLPIVLGEEVEQAVKAYMEGSSWALREKAAKATSSNIVPSDVVQHVHELLALDLCSQNALHGRLMCLKWLLRRTREELYQSPSSKNTHAQACSARLNRS